MANLCPQEYVPVDSGFTAVRPIDVCIHLRSLGLDARYVSTPKAKGVVLVPPKKQKQAQGFVRSYRANRTDWRDDYRKIRAREQAAKKVAERAGAA